MKRKIIVLALAILCSTALFSQVKKAEHKTPTPDNKKTEVKKEEDFDLGDEMKKVFDTKVDADIDKILFDKSMGNMYMNEEKHAMLMIMVVPSTLEKMASDMKKDEKKDGFKLISKGTFDTLGKTIVYEKGIMKKEVDVYTEIYAVKANEKSCIMITGGYKLEDKAMFEKALMRVVCTAKLADSKQ